MASCTYCGKPEPKTADHIPPACLFPAPRPSDLVTVPCCLDCNKGASKDDEYFRMMLVMRRGATHPAIPKLLDAVHRGLGKPRKRGMLHGMLRSMRSVSVKTPAGLYVGRAEAYDVDLERLGRVADRIVKGLYFKEFGTRLPSTHGIRSFAESGLTEIDSDLRSTIQQTVATLVSKSPRIIGEGVFEYWFQATPEDPATTAWLMRFYAVESFLSITAPHSARPAAA